MGCLPFIGPPHSIVTSLCIGMFLGYQYVMWAFYLLLRVWGVPPSGGRFWGASVLEMSICLFLFIFVVHYVLHFYYGFDYYSSSYSGIFWPVITVISDSGSFPDRVSSKLGSAWRVPPPPLMPRGFGGVLGSVSVPQQQTPSLMPLLAYANYAMGSPQVGFFFRVESPTILYMICLVSILVSAFYF